MPHVVDASHGSACEHVAAPNEQSAWLDSTAERTGLVFRTTVADQCLHEGARLRYSSV